MDANKLKVLQLIQYEVKKTCGNCEHGRFIFTSDWGTCDKFSYHHLKHSEEIRSLSINKAGSCQHFEMSEEAGEKLGAFLDFVK